MVAKLKEIKRKCIKEIETWDEDKIREIKEEFNNDDNSKYELPKNFELIYPAKDLTNLL